MSGPNCERCGIPFLSCKCPMATLNPLTEQVVMEGNSDCEECGNHIIDCICHTYNHPWSNFLAARKQAIHWMENDLGLDDKEISKRLSTDKQQIYLIRSFSPHIPR